MGTGKSLFFWYTLDACLVTLYVVLSSADLKKKIRNTKGLDPDRAWNFVWPNVGSDLGLNCFQRLSLDVVIISR